jgi:hypothetical protein
MMAFVTWSVSIAAIPYYYNERIKGAMISAIGQFDKALKEGKQLSPAATELIVLKSLLAEMQQHNNALSERITGLTAHQEMLTQRIDELTATTQPQNFVRNATLWQPVANPTTNNTEDEDQLENYSPYLSRGMN